MLRNALKNLPKFGLFLLLLTASYGAQAQSADKMVVNIPFAFSAGNKQLPAGEYNVKRASPSSSAFTLQRTDASAAVIVLAAGALGGGVDQAKAGLVLRRHGRAYFLAQVWMPGQTVGNQVPESRVERRLRRKVGATGERPELLTLLARQ